MSDSVELTVEIGHTSAIAGAKWCRPVGWSPRNVIEGADWDDTEGVWWGDDGEAAGIIAFGDDFAERFASRPRSFVTTVRLDDLRVASCGQCRVIGEVEIDFA
jgi:hypothetical protein